MKQSSALHVSTDVGVTADDERSSCTQVVLGVAVVVVYIAVSVSLINFNKLLMSEDYFPFSAMLTTIHMGAGLVCSSLLYCAMPGLYPSMEATKGRRGQILAYLAPLACCFAISIACSNEAYHYSSVPFLQCMKPCNLCMVFALSCWVGSQVCDRMKLLVVCWITCGSAMAVTGDIHFVLLGFLIQLAGQVAESIKSVLQEWILSGSDVKLDPLTYNLFIAPCCLAVLAVADVFVWDPLIPGRMRAHWHLLVPNALTAFALNVTVSVVIKQTSAMGFILAGISKDIVIMGAAPLIFSDTLAAQQILGFSAATLGILLWSLIKMQPEHPAVRFLAASLFMPEADADAERPPLLEA